MTVSPEDEVDFGRYWAALTARWWLLAAGLVAGALVGLAVASGSKQVNRASVTIYLGQPLSANGSSQIQTLATNPSTVRVVIHSGEALDRAAAAAGIEKRVIAGGVSSAPVAGFVAKLGQTPLVAITVTGNAEPAELHRAAESLAKDALVEVAPFAAQKVENLSAQIAQDARELASIDRRLDALDGEVKGKTLSATDKLVLLNLQALAEQRRTNVLDDQLQAKQLVAQAQTVEQGRVVAASSGKTTARSKRNSVVVGALIGLILGAAAALVWARRRA